MDQTRVRKLLKEIGLAAALAAVLIGLAVGGVASTGGWHRDRDPERMRKHAEFAVEFALREVDATPEQVARVKAIVADALAELDRVHDQHAANRDNLIARSRSPRSRATPCRRSARRSSRSPTRPRPSSSTRSSTRPRCSLPSSAPS